MADSVLGQLSQCAKDLKHRLWCERVNVDCFELFFPLVNTFSACITMYSLFVPVTEMFENVCNVCFCVVYLFFFFVIGVFVCFM